MSTTTKQVYSRKTNPETGASEVTKVNKPTQVPSTAPQSEPQQQQPGEGGEQYTTTSNDEVQTGGEENTTVGNQDANVVINAPPVQQREEVSALKKEIDNMMAEISQVRFKKMTDAFKEDIILLEFVENGKVKPNRIAYVPMTMGMARKINKIGKQIRLFKEDLSGFGTDSKALTIEDLRKKYPEILQDEDIDQSDIQDEIQQNEIIMNYIMRKKCQIYWGIDDTDAYVPSDLLIMIGLYESRNSFAPS